MNDTALRDNLMEQLNIAGIESSAISINSELGRKGVSIELCDVNVIVLTLPASPAEINRLSAMGSVLFILNRIDVQSGLLIKQIHNAWLTQKPEHEKENQ